MQIDSLKITTEGQKQSAKRKSDVGNQVATLLANAHLLIQANEKELASHLLRKALYLDPEHPEALKKLDACLTSNSDQDLSLKISEKIESIEQSFLSAVRLANKFYGSELFAEAKEVYFKALNRLTDSNPSLFEVYKNLGNIFLKEADLESAEEFYHKAYAIDSQSDVLLVNLGTLAIQTQEFELALSRFRQALEINSKNDKAWVGLALVHRQMGDLVLSKANLESALDVNPLNRTAVHLVADWGLREKNFEFVENTLIEYVSGVEFDEEMSLLLIHTFCLNGKIVEASLELERMLLWDPSNARLLQIEKELKGVL